MSRSTQTISLLILGLSPLLHAQNAAAQAAGPDIAEQKRACVIEHEQAQVLRRTSQLKAARESLLVCAQDICPSAVRNDCLPWLEQVAKNIPSVVVRAKLNGSDVFDVRVYVDGKPVAARLDGKSLEFDPGLHSFRFEHSSRTIEQDVLLGEGQENRVILVDLDPPKPKEEGGGILNPQLKPTPELKRGPMPAISYILGGVAVVGVAGFAGAGLWGQDERKNLQTKCQPVCSSSDVDKVRTKFMIADASLGVAILATLGAGYFYFTRPYETPHPPPATPAAPKAKIKPTLDLAATPWGGFINVRGEF